MCSLLPTYLVIQSAPKMEEKKFKATIFEMFSSLQRSPPSNGFVMFMKNFGGNFDFSYFIYPVHTR